MKDKTRSMLPERLKKLREERGCSIEQFAALVGVTRPTMSYYLSGQRSPDAETLAQICRALNVSCDWLLGLPVAYAANINARMTAAEYVDLPLGVVDQLRNGTAHVYSDALIHSIINALSDSLNINQEKGASNGNL